MNLNLGCSDDLLKDFVNVDRVRPAGFEVVNKIREGWEHLRIPGAIAEFQRVDLCEPWPWPDSSVDCIRAKDIFEHLDNERWRGQRGIIFCLNEAHRVLRRGGILHLIVPCLPGVAPWVDPTHVSVWTPDLRYYFCEEWNNPAGERGRLGPDYGITALFRTVGGRSGRDWTPIAYAPDAPDRHKLFVDLEALK